MGNPVTGPQGRSGETSTSSSCPGIRPARRNDRAPNTIRRRAATPSLDPLELSNGSQDWSLWTRNIRQRAEILHTNAPSEGANGSEGEESRRGTESDLVTVGKPAAETKAAVRPKHRYTLRLGYDPRVFLEDPLLRGQKLTPEAEEWAASYRSRIPMTTDLQLARRFEPEAGRFSSSPQQLAGIQPTAAMDSSDDEFSLQDAPDATLRHGFAQEGRNPDEGLTEAYTALQGRVWRARAGRANRSPDEPPVRLSLLHQLAATESPFRSASSRERLSMLGEAISAATWELSQTPGQAAQGTLNRGRDRLTESQMLREAPHETNLRERRGLHRERLRELERLLNEGPSAIHRRLASQWLERHEGNAA